MRVDQVPIARAGAPGRCRAPEVRRSARRHVLGLAACLLVAPRPVRAQAIPVDLVRSLSGRGHALLIGVSQYQPQTGWSQLRSIPRSIPALQAALRPHFATVTALLDPTAAQLRATVTSFLGDRPQTPEDRLFLYYAGHGFTNLDQNQQRDLGYLTGIDTVQPNRDPGRAVRTAMSMSLFDTLAQESPARHVMAVFDSCFSGSIFQTRGQPNARATLNVDMVRQVMTRPVRFYIAAGDQNQTVPEPSPMADLLIEALQGEADLSRDGIISAYELGLYLKDRVAALTRQLAVPQFGPTLSGPLSRGDFYFLPAALPVPAPSWVEPPPVRKIPEFAQARTYLIFFDWNSAELTNRAREMLQEAATNAQRVNATAIEVAAHTDRSGTEEDNLRLSRRMADNAAAELVRVGIPRNLLRVQAYGESRPLVPTADGVREPQNRRVEIILR
ncbi:OmpA family protein [Paracraurococcus lichenis]|uniref:OmpA family protein n=1 Tax=Paracraurococcus lichenis TaxID=3064888 RepID=A0ABT9DZW7_9PROT|nr:OmpA family protein [Paracraurococcus sp. LOR1-02]MDO9709429.1 OmpA family protein [Paracraurococcus sp. LOR1-02]